MRTTPPGPPKVTRDWIARAFAVVEDTVYVGLGLLLGGCALVLLISGTFDFVHSLLSESLFSTAVIKLLDRILLILLVVELLYTVQVSFREHALLPEPFLLVGLIAAIRRVLVATAEFGHVPQQTDATFKNFFIELVVLTILILAVTTSLVLLRKRNPPVAER